LKKTEEIILGEEKMNEAISVLAEQAAQEVVQEAGRVEDKVETAAQTEVASAESEGKSAVAAAENEGMSVLASAEEELKKIEEAALRVEQNIVAKGEQVFHEVEQVVETAAKKVWHLAHGGGSVIKNPA
jgi:hypothetical protein